jgi:hypothetical protein
MRVYRQLQNETNPKPARGSGYKTKRTHPSAVARTAKRSEPIPLSIGPGSTGQGSAGSLLGLQLAPSRHMGTEMIPPIC